MQTARSPKTDALSQPPDDAVLERRAMLRWTAIIVGLLGLHVTFCLVVIFVVLGDESVAIVPGYHQQALDWDASRQALRDSASLGWKVTSRIDDTSDTFGRRAIEVALIDEHGQPLSGATVSVLVFHHAHASDTQQTELTEAGPGTGVYVATLTMQQAGLWELRLTASRGTDTFLTTSVHDLR